MAGFDGGLEKYPGASQPALLRTQYSIPPALTAEAAEAKQSAKTGEYALRES